METNLELEKYSEYINDLERRCKLANVSLDDGFEWNDESVKQVEDILLAIDKKRDKGISTVMLCIVICILFLFGLYLFNTSFPLIEYMGVSVSKIIQLIYLPVFVFLTIYTFLKSIYLDELND